MLGLLLSSIIIFLPIISPGGISQSEMRSAVSSNNLELSSMVAGDVVNAPYRLLQKASISTFGLNTYAIKLPSIILGLATAFLLILIINRWFKTNVALITSFIITLSTPFLIVAGTGTPTILYLFWPALIFWLGSKIQGENNPKPVYCFALSLVLALSIFTPYMCYLAVFITAFAFTHPHLRFTLKKLPKIPLIAATLLLLGLIVPFIISVIVHPNTLMEIMFVPPGTEYTPFANINTAFAPFFSFGGGAFGEYLSPLLGLASVALIIIGAIAMWGKFFASRNSVATGLIFFTIAISSFNPLFAILILLPFAVLIATGMRLILEKWYGLFPTNPYARAFGLIPIIVFTFVIIYSGFSHFVLGYRYNPVIANEFHNDLQLIHSQLPSGTVIVLEPDSLEYDFYKILEQKTLFSVVDTLPDRVNGTLATLGKRSDINHELHSIITSPKSKGSDRIYVYIEEENNHGVRPSEDAESAP
jgi:hypothetical protein